MKYSQWLGIVAAIMLVASCFLPWAYYPDLQKSFTGFFSEENIYGRPGRTFIFFAAITSAFFMIPRLWAKRWNLFFCSLNLAYAIKTFILFTGCYRGICPQKQVGIWLMLASALGIMAAALLPDLRSRPKPDDAVRP